jgi:hypothetical protein
MATLGPGAFTLADLAKRIDDGGKIQSIVEMLSQTNEVLMDMVWKEGNLPTGERYTVRNSLPTVTWRKFNEGVAVSKSTTAQVTEGCALLEAWSEIDKELADLGGNPGAVRISEASAFLQSMSIECASKVFDGNVGLVPETFTGLGPRFASTTGTTGDNVILGGSEAGQTDNMSIYLVGWGPETVYGFYPKGTKAGLEHVDHGSGIIETTAGVAGNRMVGYRDQFIWRVGMAVKDWRYVVRIPNIDYSLLLAGSGADLFDLMIKAMHRVPSLTGANFAFYMNRICFQMLDIQTRNDVTSGGQLSYETVAGKPLRMFRGIPVRVCDALGIAETRIT